MPGTNLEWAIAAYVHCVEALETLGSDNKRFAAGLRRRDDEDAIDLGREERRIRRDMAIKSDLKPNQPKQGASMSDVVAYGVKATIKKAGNCFEHAAVAASFLHAQGADAPSFDVVQIPTLDHAFVVVGQPAPQAGVYPLQFAQWGADAAICDGWARICCPARHYATIWDRTMNVWVSGGMEVPIGNMQWGSPATYRGEVERYPKQSYTVVPPPPGWSCLIATAACASLGLGDDCDELASLRLFRDRVLRQDPEWRARVDVYYALAPLALDAIKRSPDATATLRGIYEGRIAPAAAALRRDDHTQAKAMFLALLGELAALTAAAQPGGLNPSTSAIE